MLTAGMRRRPQGFSLVELVIALAIMGILMALGLPSYREIIRNSAIRGSAESFLSGLQLAKVEALKRNLTIRFAVVDSLDATCTLLSPGVTTTAYWIMSRNSAIGACDATADPSISISPTATTVFVLNKPPPRTNSGVLVSPSSSLFCFNSLGMLTDTGCTGGTTAAATIDFSSGDGACRTSLSGPGLACLRVAVSAGGTAKLCDPLVTTAGDSRRCP